VIKQKSIFKQILKKMFRIFFLLLLINSAAVQAQQPVLQWEPREDLNILLPPSVRVFEASGNLDDGARVRATYATVNLNDKNLSLRAVGDNVQRQTTEEAYLQYNGILAINGGYFSSNSSVSLLVSDGEIVAPGPKPGTTRGAFGLVNGKPEIVWPYAIENNLYKYPKPGESGLSSPAIADDANRWPANQAIGGGPVLIKKGKIRDYSKEEGFGGSHIQRHPRTAIGYLNDSTLLLMVVDGRQKASAGVTIKELAQLMWEAGCYEAVNLDGGGSSAMVAAGEVVNIPADTPGGDQHSLRKNASALILSELVPTLNKDVIYFDTDSRYYSEEGLWKSSNHFNYYGTTPSRLASSGQDYNKARYIFEDIPDAKYQVAVWWTVNEDSNTDQAYYILHHSKGSDTIVMDQSSLSGSGEWNVLGDFVLTPGSYLELIGGGNEGKIVMDALRLVALEKFPRQRRRGDLRVAVISDLNSGLGAASYEWQVDSIINRIPRIWQPDLVICGGDMVAGMGISDTATLARMWAGFDKHIAAPLRKAGIPFAFTLGNHDGPRSYPVERKAAKNYWTNPENDPGLQFVDKKNFPSYYTFIKDDVFIASWDASSSKITEENLEWLVEQLETPEAKNAKFRFVMGHMPLYSVAQERDSKGNVLENPERLRQLLQKYKVHTYISGHQHAYYPGKRGKLELLNTGAAGSGPRSWLTLPDAPVNTVTFMDIFYREDTIIYTTYDIRQKKADDMMVFDESKLPAAIFGVNGHLIRRDMRETKKASAKFSALNNDKYTETDFGNAEAEIEGNELLISGNFLNLEGKLLKDPSAIALYKGRNTEQGELVLPLKIKAKNNRTGTFKGTLTLSENLKEFLSVGNLHIKIKTQENPKGELRAQLYPAHNRQPYSTSFTSHNVRNVYAVRNIEALYKIKWEKAEDLDGDFVSYTYQLATDPWFENILYHKNTGRVNSFKQLEQDWHALLGKADEGTPVIFYQRVIASDGKNNNIGSPHRLQLMKSNEPLEDYVEVAAPEFVFAGKIKNAPGAGYGAQWDKDGKLWLADYGGSLIVKEKDGTDAAFSPIKAVTINERTYSLRPVNGIGIDLDGNILIGSNRHLIKISAKTGEGIAVWEAPKGKRAITSPRVNDKGEIFAMSLFAEDPNYVLRQSKSNPSTFELIREIHLPGRILARTFDMAPDGLTLYFPNPGSPFIQKYTSIDGITFKKEDDITSTAAGCNAIAVGTDNSLFTAVRSSGINPSTFHFRDDTKKIMWTLPLPEVNGAEARGIGISPDGDTLIFCSWDKGGGYYRFVRER
jgi:Icc-related predicted phosphoesterase